MNLLPLFSSSKIKNFWNYLSRISILHPVGADRAVFESFPTFLYNRQIMRMDRKIQLSPERKSEQKSTGKSGQKQHLDSNEKYTIKFLGFRENFPWHKNFRMFCCQQNVRFLIVCRVVYPCSGCELKYSLRILFFEWNSKMRGFKIDPLPITVSDFLIEKAKQLQVLK